MNVAARLVAGEQKQNYEWPQDACAAEAPFKDWVKVLAFLAVGSTDLTRPGVVTSLRAPSLIAKKCDPERIEECVQSLEKVAVPRPILSS